MNQKLQSLIENFNQSNISNERKKILSPFIDYLQKKVNLKESIRLNFICTHNSRRSLFSQIWAQTMGFYFKIPKIYCYSGGTETTAIYIKVIKTLKNQGFQILKLSENENPIYSIKYSENEPSIIGFSKKYQHEFNPQSQFIAVMTCTNADVDCPIVLGAEARFSIPYDDPKIYDRTELEDKKYEECSFKIAQEMWWVFQSIHVK